MSESAILVLSFDVDHHHARTIIIIIVVVSTRKCQFSGCNHCAKYYQTKRSSICFLCVFKSFWRCLVSSKLEIVFRVLNSIWTPTHSQIRQVCERRSRRVREGRQFSRTLLTDSQHSPRRRRRLTQNTPSSRRRKIYTRQRARSDRERERAQQRKISVLCKRKTRKISRHRISPAYRAVLWFVVSQFEEDCFV